MYIKPLVTLTNEINDIIHTRIVHVADNLSILDLNRKLSLRKVFQTIFASTKSLPHQ